MHLSGSPFDYVVAFLGGVAVSLTPCVYPLIPVSIGYIGIRSAGSKLKGLALGLAYVTGIAFTYSIIGLAASLTGRLFGSISANPLTNIFVGLVILFFGISMLGFFNVSLMGLVKLPKLKQHNYFSTFLLGLVSGLVIGPCLTPVLGSILVYLTTQKKILYGMSLLFVFAYGMGLIFLITSVFGATIIRLPSLGKWLAYVQKLVAFILIVTGTYFIFIGIKGF